MHALPLRKFALSPRGGCRGVSCDTDGAFIHGIPLLKCEWKNGKTFWSARNIDDISDQLSLRLDLPIDVSPKSVALSAIARDLNNGDLVHAQLVALHLQVPDLPLANAASQSERISFVRKLHLSGLLRKVWDPDEHPRWPAGAPESQGGQFAPEGEGSSQGTTVSERAGPPDRHNHVSPKNPTHLRSWSDWASEQHGRPIWAIANWITPASLELDEAEFLELYGARMGLRPGPFAEESVPASGPRINADEQTEIDQLGAKNGCHTCGTRTSGMKDGHWVGDHQPFQRS